MSLSKEVIVDLIEVLENGCVQSRTTTRVYDEGVIVASSSHRRMCEPGHTHDKNEDPRVHAVCLAVHTPEVIAAYKVAMKKIKDNINV